MRTTPEGVMTTEIYLNEHGGGFSDLYFSFSFFFYPSLAVRQGCIHYQD
jgi:hypothetical protein